MLREAITASPLHWPANQPRTQNPSRSAFDRTTIGVQAQNVLEELSRMGVADSLVKVSSNLRLNKDGSPTSKQAQPIDQGVAVWFEFNESEHVLACDRWDRIEHNLRAIVLHIAALRGQERWGVGSLEQAFRGFMAIPAETGRPWREVLGFGSDDHVDLAMLDKARKRRSLDYHPDHGGTLQQWHELMRAVDQAKKELR